MTTPPTILGALRAAMAAALLFPNLCFGQVTQMLHSTPPSPARDNYTGGIGCQFQVGPTNVIVSHLGVFDIGDDGLNTTHNAGLFNANGSTLLGQVTVPAGTDAYLTNGFRWVPLDPPLLLSSNTTYLVAGIVSASDGDTWQDAFAPTWNPFYVGTTATTTRHAMYGPGGTTAWPPASFSQNGNNNAYGNVSLAYIEIDQARVGVQQTNVSLSAGQTLSVLGFASGQPPITYQWYQAPNTPLPGQTSATLVIPNSTTNTSGTYFLTASNALGGEQSANVTVLVTSFPVGITKQPTNITVFANYPVSMSITATGSPPISYQWFRNSSPVPGATASAIALASANQTNNGDVFSVVVSNFTSGTAYTATSDNATLTVIPNQAQPQQILHGYRTNLNQNGFSGMVGGQFTVGNSRVTLTHLGYYAPTNQYTDATHCSLSSDHRVGIFSANGTVLIAYATVPAGVGNVVNGYIWAQLDSPLVLTNNTQYLLATEVFGGVDPWGDTYAIPDLNPYFATSCAATYWGAAWPGGGASGSFAGQMYSAPNLAVLALSTPSAFVAPASVTQYVGLNVTLTATVAGQPPVTVQWYKSPSTQLAGQTNLTLNFSNAQLSDSGDYYVIATGPGGSAQSTNATVNIVPDIGPGIDHDIAPVSAYAHQTVRLAIGASGTPPLSYQWTFNGNAIAGATTSILTIQDASAASDGNYQVTITNAWGTTNSSVAALSVTIPAWGSYPSAVTATNLIAYFRFSDVNSGFGIATNQGSLGLGLDALYEGGFSGATGPTGFANFEPDNPAVALDGFSADLAIPPLGVRVTNATIAAWVYQNDGQAAIQAANAGIYFHRSSDVFGLSVNPDPATGGASLRYTWNGAFFNFVSGLVLPTNQWAFIAAVITPTNASLYLQDGAGLKVTNNVATHNPVTFAGTNYVGWDTAGGITGRRWNGSIDELMIFNTALSPVAVNALTLGVPASATLTLAPSGNNLILTWPGGTLLESTNVNGPWTPVTGATSPYPVGPTGAMKFYRVKLQ
jgi:hypothetical protein